MEKTQNIKRFKSDTELLDFVKDKISEQIQLDQVKLKVGDLVKILELQKKLATDSRAEDKFWEVIEKLRQEELKDA